MPSIAARMRHAERTRLYRQRLREGRRVLAVRVETERLVPMLISGKHLREADEEDRFEIARALERAIAEAIAIYEAELARS